MKKQSRLENKWVILGVCFLMVFTVLGFCSGNKSLYLSAITEALGIKRSLFSINDSCRYVATAVVNLFFGRLIAKFGAKKLVMAGFLSLIVSCLIYAYAESIYLFYVGGIFLGMGVAWTTTTMVSYIVSKWFTQNRGTVMGFALAANGLGGAVAAQIISPIIYREGTLFGYRDAYLLTAVILLAVAVLAVIFLKEKPSDAKESALPAKKKIRGQTWEGLEFSQVSKTWYFVLAAVCVFVTGMALQSVSGVAAAHMKDVGLSAAYVSKVLSFHALALAGFKFLTGIIYDRFGLKVAMLICDAAAIINVFLLAILTNTPQGRVLAMIYGIFISLAMPLETIIIPFIAADLFGEKSYSKALGIILAINTAGYALGTPVTNVVFDKVGTYKPVLMVLSGIMVVVAVLFQLVLAKTKKVRDSVTAETERSL